MRERVGLKSFKHHTLPTKCDRLWYLRKRTSAEQRSGHGVEDKDSRKREGEGMEHEQRQRDE